jgi:hypothetical protein
MTRTRSEKSLTELLVMVVVLLGLSGMLAHAFQRICVAADHTFSRAGAVGTAASASVNNPHRASVP